MEGRKMVTFCKELENAYQIKIDCSFLDQFETDHAKDFWHLYMMHECEEK